MADQETSQTTDAKAVRAAFWGALYRRYRATVNELEARWKIGVLRFFGVVDTVAYIRARIEGRDRDLEQFAKTLRIFNRVLRSRSDLARLYALAVKREEVAMERLAQKMAAQLPLTGDELSPDDAAPDISPDSETNHGERPERSGAEG